jgi:hypothetical protein
VQVIHAAPLRVALPLCIYISLHLSLCHVPILELG